MTLLSLKLPYYPSNGYVLLLKTQNPDLKELYSNQCAKLFTEKHIENQHKDSGFDLYMPDTVFIFPHTTKLIDLDIKCSLYKTRTGYYYSKEQSSSYIPSPYYIYARSSISKKKLMLANSVGIIDSGYRGNLKAALYNTSSETVKIEAGERLLQICLPHLDNNFVASIVDELDKTIRGEGGIGSTGK